MPCCLSAEIATDTVSPPHSSTISPWSASSFFTRSGLALALSILLIATTIGTLAARAWSMASIGLRHDAVVGRDDQDDESVALGAARPHQGESLVARRVEEDDLLAVERDTS